MKSEARNTLRAAAPGFQRYVGIDYSGAETPGASLKGLRVYMAQDGGLPTESPPPPSPRKYWTRRGVAEWLIERLGEDMPTLVGIDHGFSFPLDYFQAHRLAHDWDAFLDDFQAHWPTDEEIYVDFVREGIDGDGAARQGNTRWRRLTERRAGRAKSVFHFDVQGSVAKSTHSGIPWLRRIRRQLGERVHFWPFDGWGIPAGRSAIAEVYPALWSRGFANPGRTPDQHDAFSIAAWMAAADHDGRLAQALRPELTEEEQAIALIEGWILGVSASAGKRSLSSRPVSAAAHKPEKVVVDGRRRILDDFLSVDEAQVSYERYGGGMCGPVRRLALERGDSVAGLLLERGGDGDHVILVEQFRFPTYGHEGGGWLQETVAGVIDKDEDAVAALRREALEEVGYRVGEVEHIVTYFASPGGSSERIFLYFAEVRAADRVPGHGGGLAAEHEDIRIVRTPLAAFFENLERGAYRDAKICVAGFWLRNRR